MIISNRGRSNWSKCKRAAATLFILLFTPVLPRAQSIGASAITWIEIQSGPSGSGAARESQRNGKRASACGANLLPTRPGQSAICPGAKRPRRISLEKREAEAAVEHLRIAQGLEPKNGGAANSLGGAYLRIGRVPEAAEQFLLAVRSENNNPDYHFDLGNVEFVLRRDLTAAWKIDSAELLQRAAFRIS